MVDAYNELSFRYNSLARLAEKDFHGLSKLELLLLHSNGVHTVTDKTFSGLRALQVRGAERHGGLEVRKNSTAPRPASLQLPIMWDGRWAVCKLGTDIKERFAIGMPLYVEIRILKFRGAEEISQWVKCLCECEGRSLDPQ